MGVLELLLALALELLLVDQLPLLVHLVVVLSHALLLVLRVYHRVSCTSTSPSRVVKGQKRELGQLNTVVRGMREKTVTICHSMDRSSLNFQLLQTLVKVDVTLDTPDVSRLSHLGLVKCFVEL